MAGLASSIKRVLIGPPKNDSGEGQTPTPKPATPKGDPKKSGGQVVTGRQAQGSGASVLGAVRKRAGILSLLTVVSLGAGIGLAFLLVDQPIAGSVLLSRLVVITFVILLITLANVLYVSYLTLIELGGITRAPKLALSLSNPQAGGRAVLLMGRSNTIEISLVNQGSAVAKYIHAAFKWSGEGEANLRDNGGAYLDRRFWEEGDGRIRMYRGGHENVVLSGRQHSVAELHVPDPSGPLKLSFKIYCEDMDEVQGEIEIGTKEL